MKKILVIMLVVASLAVADVLWENSWDIDEDQNGLQSCGVNHCQDDFALPGYAVVESFTCWGYFSHGRDDPFDVTFFEDDNGHPGDPFWSETITDTILTHEYGGVWRIDMTPESPIELFAGIYWAEFYYTELWFWWAAGADGNMHLNGYDYGYDAFFGIYGYYEEANPPYVDGLDPDDGDVQVPLDSTIVFHCVDLLSSIDLDTIDFTAQDTSLSDGRAVSAGAALSVAHDSTRSIAGEMDLDDADPLDVVCTFTPYDPLYGDNTIICTVDGCLADIYGNEMGDDFVWSFDTEVAVKETTWGAIKAAF